MYDQFDIIPGDSPLLRETAVGVDVDDAEDFPIVAEFARRLHGYLLDRFPSAVGIAAPQVGVSRRVFVISYGGRDHICINPEIVNWSGNTKIGNEGCLSFPGVIVPVERDTKIKVRFITPEGIETSFYMKNFVARIFQHELDHLNGVLITER